MAATPSRGPTVATTDAPKPVPDAMKGHPVPDAAPPRPEKSAPALASMKVDRGLADRFTALAVFHDETPRECLEKLMRAHVEAHMPAKPAQAP